MKTPLETLRHHVTGAIERGEAEAITEIHATPAPVWRLLEPGEIIQEGDEWSSSSLNVWHECDRSLLGANATFTNPIRRRLEPDPVKAELLAALESIYTHCIHNIPGMSEYGEGAREMKAARLAIARAKSTA